MFTVIHAQSATEDVTWMCDQLNVPRASYYRSLETQPTATTVRHEQLTKAVQVVFKASEQIAGHRMVQQKLTAAGTEVSVGTVAAIMAENGWQAKRMRAFKRTTISDDSAPIFEDLLKRDFTAQAPGTKLVGDITYLRTDQGWLYLATVIDLYTGMVIGWSMTPHMKTTLIIDAMTMARDHGHLQTGAIFHSDHGSQYTSKAFGSWCRGNQIRQSMGMTGQCWDNAVAESFFSTLKNEFYHHYSFQTHKAARTAVMRYIEVFYNRWRPHTINAGLPPATALANYRQNQLQQKTAA